jgi:phage baseplate assembly protein W
MRVASAAWCERAVRDGAVGFLGDSRHVQWTAAAAARQSGDLCANRHTAVRCLCAAARHGDVSAMNLDYPFHFDARGRTAAAGDVDHVRDMIEELLFTSPGERVNRPEFGSGLLQLVFAPNSPELAAALQFTLQAALQRWLGDVIDVGALEVTSEDSTLSVKLTYTIRASRETRTDSFVRDVP